jgi:RNA polymerase sigma-70 factor (ECF subfamily)
VRTGDEEAFRQLFDTYWEPLVGYAAMIIGAGDDCEDVALQAFVRVWRHRTKWAGNGAVRPYLYRITRNLALNARRDRLVRDARQRTTQLIEGDANHHRTPAQHLLPERRRDAFVLSRFHGLSHHEIADTLGISSQTVANHLSAAMADLRITLAHHLTDA